MRHTFDFFIRRFEKMKTLEKTQDTKTICNKHEWEKLCDECSFAVQKNGWTKNHSKKLLKEVREELKRSETC